MGKSPPTTLFQAGEVLYFTQICKGPDSRQDDLANKRPAWMDIARGDVAVVFRAPAGIRNPSVRPLSLYVSASHDTSTALKEGGLLSLDNSGVFARPFRLAV